jgi:NAD-dependent deacetylase
MRIREGIKAKPNAAHTALKQLEDTSEAVTIVTSNVDHLHHLAGSKQVYRLHGDILETLCTNCKGVDDLEMSLVDQELTEETVPRCMCGGMLRPNVVWFGEYPWPEAFEAVQREMPKANIVLEIGVSGTVSYGFSQIAARTEIPVIRINPDGEREHGITLIKENAEIALPRLVSKARQLT